MSQNSLVLPTSGTLSGLAAVQGINAALDTLNTLSSGASAPSSTEAGQLWHDTGNKLLKMRSMDNTAWIVLGALDETNYVFNAAVKPAPAIYGLTPSNDATTPGSVIDISPGGACDVTGSVYIRLLASMKKNVTQAWVVGTGNGSLDTGTWQASKGYHIHLIYDASSGAVDLLTSLSYTNPVLPSGYAYSVPIHGFLSDSTSAVIAATWTGNECLLKTAINDFGSGGSISASSTAALFGLSVPQGVALIAKIRGTLAAEDTSGTAQLSTLFSSPLETDQLPSPTGPATLSLGAYNGTVVASSGDLRIRTNTSGQIRVRSNTTYAASQIWGYTFGFEYPRGLP